MVRKTLSLIAFITALAAASGEIRAETISIFKATLAEENAKTGEVSTEQMRMIMDNNSAIILDTRSRAEFDAGHIPNARNLDAAPSAQLAAVEAVVNGDKTKALILYCNGPFCQASRRLGENLAAAGFTNVRRYQLGIPVWRALGGPVEIELGGIKRIFKADQTAVYFDTRPASEFAKGSLPGAINASADDVISGQLKKMALPEDDFNRRIVLFGANGAQARKLADFMGKRPWHNVSYFPGTYDALASALK